MLLESHAYFSSSVPEAASLRDGRLIMFAVAGTRKFAYISSSCCKICMMRSLRRFQSVGWFGLFSLLSKFWTLCWGPDWIHSLTSLLVSCGVRIIALSFPRDVTHQVSSIVAPVGCIGVGSSSCIITASDASPDVVCSYVRLFMVVF